MINVDEYDIFIFDCDGVILDSNKLKSNAFAESLPNEPPDLVAEFVEYHKKNGGISRYEKFRYYYKNMKKQIEAEAEIDKALNTFAIIVREIYKLFSDKEKLGVGSKAKFRYVTFFTKINY